MGKFAGRCTLATAPMSSCEQGLSRHLGNISARFIRLASSQQTTGLRSGLTPKAMGAGFLLSDRYLAPLLAAALLFTLLIDGLHLRLHHQPGPFILSLLAAGSVFFAIYGVGLLPQAGGGDRMADGMAATPTWSPYLAYGAILVLLGAQVWDLWLYRRCVRRVASVPTDSVSGFSETRKEGV